MKKQYPPLWKKIKVKKVIPQNSIKNLQGRSVVLDALCETEDGEEFNVEVQKADDDDHVKRVRYNTSCITANITEPGTKFEKFPKVSGRKKQFKKSDEGDERMCELVENYAKKVAEKAAAKAATAKEKENALRLFQNGVSYEVVRASILSLSDEDLQQIYDEAIN